jgi:predicted nucleotidyltransferase
MTGVDPLVVAVLSDLVRGLRALQTEFCLIGAVVPELLLGVTPPRLTKEVDVAVILDSLDDFERLKERLEGFNLGPTTWRPYRLTHQSGGWVDLLPYSEILAPMGRLELTQDLSFNMAGFDQVLPGAIHVQVTSELTVPVTPLPLYVLLKFVAFADRKEPKDLASVLHCLRHYAEDDDRRYGLDHDGEAVLFEHTTAYLLGQDGRRFHSVQLSAAVDGVLKDFDSPDAMVVELAAREEAGFFIEDERRQDVFDLFRSFRAGLSRIHS